MRASMLPELIGRSGRPWPHTGAWAAAGRLSAAAELIRAAGRGTAWRRHAATQSPDSREALPPALTPAPAIPAGSGPKIACRRAIAVALACSRWTAERMHGPGP